MNYLEKIQADQVDFEKLYKRYYQRLLNFSYQFTKNREQSQDLVHEVFLKYWENRTKIENRTIEAMLFRMTRNVCLNYLKHLKIVQNKQLDLEKIGRWEELYRIEFIKDEPYILIEKELEDKIRQVMESLPEKCREVFNLSRLRGMKNREIAEKLKISSKTVEKHINRALREFKQQLPVIIPIQLVILVLSQI